MNLLKQYNLKQSQYDYEVKRAEKNNLKIEDWLKYRFSKKNSQLVDKNNNYKGRSLVVDILDNFGQETGFLLDRSLQIRFGNWLGKNKTFCKFSYGVDNYKDKKIKYSWVDRQELAFQELDTLIQLEINIKNTELFWILFGYFRYFLRILTHREDEIKSMLRRYDRLNVSLLYRSQWVEFLPSIKELIFNSDYNNFERTNNILIEELIDINKKYSDLDYITIYRGFQLLVGEKNIRDELNKKKQKFGRGFYYTINKDFGKLYAMSLNAYGFFNSLIYTFNDSELEHYRRQDDFLKHDIHKLKIDRDKFTLDKNYRNKIFKTKIYNDFFNTHIENIMKTKLDHQLLKYDRKNRSLIGTYKVRKKDIIFYSNAEKTVFNIGCQEQSIFCFDENVELVRYEFIPQKDFSMINKMNVKRSRIQKLKDDFDFRFGSGSFDERYEKLCGTVD